MRWSLMVLSMLSGCSLLIDPGDNECTRCSVDASFGDGLIHQAGISSGASSADNQPFSFPYKTAGTGQFLVLGVAVGDSTAEITAAKYGEQELWYRTTAGIGELRLEVWTLANPTVGQHDIALEASSQVEILGMALAFEGVDLSSDPVLDIAQQVTIGNALSTPVQSEARELIVALFGQWDTSLGGFSLLGGFHEEQRVTHGEEAFRLVGATRVGNPDVEVGAQMDGDPFAALVALRLRPAAE